jgi:hypothetical protein
LVTEPLLRRVTIERLDDGRWKLVRERDENGETFMCEDLVEAFQTVRAAYAPDGRPWTMVRRVETSPLARDADEGNRTT